MRRRRARTTLAATITSPHHSTKTSPATTTATALRGPACTTFVFADETRSTENRAVRGAGGVASCSSSVTAAATSASAFLRSGPRASSVITGSGELTRALSA